jgi:hypothetical protein
MWLFRVADQLWMVFSCPNSAMTDQPAVFISCSHVDGERKDRFVRYLNVSPDLWGTISSRWMPGLFPERTT